MRNIVFALGLAAYSCNCSRLAKSKSVSESSEEPKALKDLALLLSSTETAPGFSLAPAARGIRSNMNSRLQEPVMDAAKGSHIAVVGAGAVGATTAFCIASSKIGNAKITLTDIIQDFLEGQVMDMEDTGTTCTEATSKEAGQADVIIITAGRGVKSGETRLDCLKANYGILKSIVDGLKPIKPTAKIIVVSNPCDVLGYFVWKFSGLPWNQVIGSGTSLDTTRLRAKLAETLEMNPASISIDMLGEHGEAMFPVTSLATIAGVPMAKYPGMDKVDMEKVEEDTRIKGRLIREKKGATAFGIATACKTIAQAILQDSREIIPVSIKIPDEETFLSLPCVVGANGIEKIVDVLPYLNENEKALWDKAIEKMGGMVADVQ